MSNRREVEDFFTHDGLTEERLDMKEVRVNCREVFISIFENLPDNRERSIAITKLQETLMWAKASIAKKQEAANG